MKDAVTNVGAFKPTTAVIRAADQEDYIVSSISVRDRLVKTCVASGIKRIIIIAPENDVTSRPEKAPYIAYANESSSTVEHVNTAEDLTISDQESLLYIEDGFLLHTSLLDDFVSSGAKVLKSPSSPKNIFSRDNFTLQADTTYGVSEIFNGTPFHIFDMKDGHRAEARSRLFKWLSKDSDGFISKTLNRPVSTFFSRFFAEYPIAPAYFTAVTALLAALMTYVLIIGGEAGILWGCILFHVVSVADGIDGEIARAKFQSSLSGAKLDTTIDMITNILFMGTMSYALWNTYGDTYLTLGIYIVLLALTGVMLMTMLLYFGPGGGRFDILAETIRAHYMTRPFLLKVFNFCNYCLKRDAFAFIFAVFGLFGFGKYIPEFLIFGLVVWNLAIITNARSILTTKQAPSET